MIENMAEGDIYTLTDEEDGSEKEYAVLGTCADDDGKEYVALLPNEEDAEEYVILRCEEDENGDPIFSTIDDDEEFDRVAEYFDDQLFNEVDYDAEGEEEK